MSYSKDYKLISNTLQASHPFQKLLKEYIDFRMKKSSSMSSSHRKMREKSLFSKLSEEIIPLRDAVRAMLPQHWGMNDWGFHISADGKKLKWSSKNGTSTKGHTLSANEMGLAQFLGYIGSLSKNSTQSFKVDETRLKKFKLDPKSTQHPFMFNVEVLKMTTFREEIHTHTGKTPVDAYAQMLLKGIVDERTTRQSINPKHTVDENILAGWRRGNHHCLSKGRNWSGSLFLWDLIVQDKNIKKILQSNRIPTARSKLQIDYGLFHSESNCLSILRSLEKIEKPGKIGSYYIEDRYKKGQLYKAWDVNSAVLAYTLTHLNNPKYLVERKTLVAYLVGEPLKPSILK